MVPVIARMSMSKGLVSFLLVAPLALFL